MIRTVLSVIALLCWCFFSRVECFQIGGTRDADVYAMRSIERTRAIRSVSSDDEESTTISSMPPARPLTTSQPSKPSPPPIVMTSADIAMRAIGTSPRRLVVSALSATGVALAANFLGSTSAVLGLLSESTVQRTDLDTYYPRAGYKRYNSRLYSFVIPQEWVGDTALELQKAQLRAKPLDYSMPPRSRRQSTSTAPSVLPDVAFGPPGRLAGGRRDVSSADTNVSVIVSDVLPGFSMAGTLGTPEQAASYLLKGMNRDIRLIEARLDDQRNVYELEYQVNRPHGESLRCISVIGFIARTNTLVTQTVVAPSSQWSSDSSNSDAADKLRKVASSFRLNQVASS